MTYQAKYLKPSSRPPMRLGSLMIRIALVLLCLVMVSIHLMSGMYAKYTTKGNGTDDARVAKFDVKITGDAAADLNVTFGTDSITDAYTITVRNDSEVVVRYTLSVVVTAPDENNDGTPDFVFDSSAVSMTSDKGNEGTLDIGDQITHKMSFVVSNWSEITKHMTNEDNAVSLDFTVTIDVVQVD